MTLRSPLPACGNQTFGIQSVYLTRCCLGTLIIVHFWFGSIIVWCYLCCLFPFSRAYTVCPHCLLMESHWSFLKIDEMSPCPRAHTCILYILVGNVSQFQFHCCHVCCKIVPLLSIAPASCSVWADFYPDPHWNQWAHSAAHMEYLTGSGPCLHSALCFFSFYLQSLILHCLPPYAAIYTHTEQNQSDHKMQANQSGNILYPFCTGVNDNIRHKAMDNQMCLPWSVLLCLVRVCISLAHFTLVNCFAVKVLCRELYQLTCCLAFILPQRFILVCDRVCSPHSSWKG